MAKILQRIREFTPKAGNEDREEGQEPIKVFLRPVDVYTKQTHIRKFLNKSGPELMQDMMSQEGSKEIKEILTKCVHHFANLEVVDEPSKEELKAALDAKREPTQPSPRTALFEDVWAMGEWQLCLEIFTDILNNSQLTKEAVKNSNSQSGSPQTPEVQVH